MNDYNFNVLNDKEFEKLAIELIGNQENVQVERFTPGRDQGIDGRFYSPSVGSVIIQAKHYAGTGLGGLLRTLENDELPKIKKLNPSRYILVTSVGLTPQNKNTIKSLFHPYILSTNDIYGKEGVNDLLTQHPSVEKNFYKLWISSTNVLINILNNGIVQKSKFLIEEAHLESARYIQTKQFDEALDILKEKHALVITGSPGVGKTTLAKQLALFHSYKGYEIYHIEDSISEAESCFCPEKMQFFYFDDFLGANYLDVIEGNFDSKIMNFIRRVTLDKNKRFVLTSRSNILNRAKSISDIFNFGNISNREYEISVTELTQIEKANILYNHIWHSSLPTEFSDVYFDNKNYWEIIKHNNFNPRLISIITDSERLSGLSNEEYWPYIRNALKNPEIIWDLYFKRQIPDEIYDLINIVVLNGGNIEETKCKEILKRVFEKKHKNDYYAKVHKIDDLIKESLKSTLNRNIRLNQIPHVISITPFNPSISDYIINRISKDDTNLSLYLLASETHQSINTFFSLAVDNTLDNHTFNSVLNILISNSMSKEINNYAKHLYYKVLTSDMPDTEKLKKIPPSTFLNLNKSRVSYDFEIGECVIWAIENQPHLFSEKFAIEFIDYALCSSKQYSLYHEDYLPLAKLMIFYPDIEQEIKFIELKENIIDFWESGFDEILGDSAKIQNLYPDDFDRADDVALNYLHEFLDEYPFEFHENDIESIMDNIDISSHLPDYSDYHNDDDGYRPTTTHYVNSERYIDDLFSK
ncbi:restriction endonuclease [Klebsiella grimontii]|uniref:nSTAND3 domain-containing NTPase n=1 Tax=Klebsiella grimontii TaxID=2058152 RepID=UPI002FCC63B3